MTQEMIGGNLCWMDRLGWIDSEVERIILESPAGSELQQRRPVVGVVLHLSIYRRRPQMATTPWWRRLLDGIEREYERRIRAASKVVEYGADQHAEHDEEDDAVEIVNVPRGTPLRRSALSADRRDTEPRSDG